MAPIRKRTALRARVAKSPINAISKPRSGHVLRTAISTDSLTDAWRTSKKDKRSIKHNTLMAKVRDAGVKKHKRRRPGKKLKADVAGLADALPDISDMPERSATATEDEEGWEGLSDDGEAGHSAMDVESAGLRKARRRRRPEGEGKMVMKSLKHRPGAMKRKRAMEVVQMERFQRNLAQLAGGQQVAEATHSQGSEPAGNVQEQARHADRWAALRSFIGGTMEKDKAFAKV